MGWLLLRAWHGMKPLVFKLGIAIAVSAAGYVAAKLSSKPRRPFSPSSSVVIGLEAGDEHGIAAATCGASRCLADQLRILRNEEALAQIMNGTFTASSTTSTAAIAEPPLSTKNSSEGRGILLLELNELISEEFDATRQDFETMPTDSLLTELYGKDERALQQEITHLKDMVWFLKARESSLEVNLLEYCGIKEQETATRELENRLKISKVEAQLLSMKVESLQAENERLRVQASEYSRMMIELEAAKVKVKLLKKKLKDEGEQAKEKTASLQQRILTLEEREVRDGGDAALIERKVKDLEEEIASLRRMNSKLAHENSGLAKKLESTPMLSSSLLDAPEAKALEEASRLRETNDNLSKEIQQLQTDRCADVEELVYLRWINACLRYELRNYNPPKGKTIARDLSKSLSPRSEQKAKQLILEYANSGLDNEGINLLDFDSEYSSSSSSQASETEAEDTSFDVPSMTKNSRSIKSKFFSKLTKLIRGKGSHRNRAFSVCRTPTTSGNSEGSIPGFTCSSDDMIGRCSCDSNSSCITDEQHSRAAWSQSFSGLSSDTALLLKLDLDEIKNRKRERSECAVGRSNGHRRIIPEEDSPNGLKMDNLIEYEDDAPENAPLRKFARALESSHEKPKLNAGTSFGYC